MATAERVEEALREPLQIGQTRIVAARVRLGEDWSGEAALLVKLMLSDPPVGRDTWPIEDIMGIRRAIRALVTRADPELKVPWVISFLPESPDELDPEDLQDAIEIDF